MMRLRKAALAPVWALSFKRVSLILELKPFNIGLLGKRYYSLRGVL